MTTVLLTGNLLHRDYDIISSACVAAIIILCISPYSIYGIGFQYSFCTVVGIGFATEFIRKQKIKNTALSALIVSLAASIFGKPIGILHNYRITFTDILANLVITGIVSVIFTLGLIGGILGIFSVSLGRFAVSNAYLLLKYTLFVGNLFANLPFSYISVGGFSFGSIIFIYISMICVYNIVTEKNYRYGASLTLITLSLLTLNTKNIKNTKKSEVLTGNKYCEVITSPSDCFVINCGDNRYQNSGRRTLLPYLRYNSVNHINGVFLTDDKFKNIDGLTDILGKIHIDKIYISEAVKENYEYKNLAKLAEKYKAEVIPVCENEVIECDDVTLNCVYDNNNLTVDTNIGE
jgi:competence protein ComEC